MLRPCGTELKLKLYLFARGGTPEKAQEKLEQLKTGMEEYLK